MADEIWDEGSREELRESIQRCVRGELRLARYDHQALLEHCRDVYMQDTCPDDEWESFLQFTTDEIEREAAKLFAEMETWPEETDCDRLDRAEQLLRDRGILLWQASPCCDTCTMGEFSDRLQVIDEQFPGLNDRLRGYTFFIDQNIPDELSEGSELTVCLGYGSISEDEADNDPEVYEKKALGIAREVCECLHAAGIKPDWDGSFSRKICITVQWQRRTLLK